MAVTQEFKNAVEQKDLLSVHIMMKDSFLLDPTCKKFDEMNHYAESNLEGLYQPHDGEILEYSQEKWSADYLNEQLVKLIGNFSRERVVLLKSMVGVLYKKEADEIYRQRQTRPATETKSHPTQKQMIGVGAIVGGGAVAVAGICAEVPVLTAVGAVAAAAGVAVLVKEGVDNR